MKEKQIRAEQFLLSIMWDLFNSARPTADIAVRRVKDAFTPSER